MSYSRRPEFISPEDYRSYLSAGKIGNLFLIDNMKASSWIVKMQKLGRNIPPVIYDGVKKYKVSHVIAKAKGCGCSISPPEVCNYRANELEDYIKGLEARIKGLKSSICLLEEKNERAELFQRAKTLVKFPIASESEIVSAATDSLPLSGVYFLIRSEKIVYVGQAVSVFSRIGTHIADPSKQFDSYFFIECPKESMNVIESIYIHILSPEYNGRSSVNEKSAPIGRNELTKILNSSSLYRNKTREEVENRARESYLKDMRTIAS